MPIGDIFKGAINVAFRRTIKDQAGQVVDISTQTTIEIIFKELVGNTTKTLGAAYPSGDTGTNGKLEYITTSSGDLNIVGVWEWHAHVILADGSDWLTDVRKFEVLAPLAP